MKENKLAQEIAQTLYSKKAGRVTLIDVSSLTIVTDCFIVASGSTAVQVKALADYVIDSTKKNGLNPVHIDGYSEGRWIVLDYSSVIVHIFHQEEREFYRFERLWENGGNSFVYKD